MLCYLNKYGLQLKTQPLSHECIFSTVTLCQTFVHYRCDEVHPPWSTANLTLKMFLIFIHYALSHLLTAIAAFGFLPVVVAVLPNQIVLSYSKIPKYRFI